MSYIEVKNSWKRYKMGDTIIAANNDVSFEVEKGELAIILGASGAGKSTMLNILGGMDSNDEGQIFIDGKDISGYNAKQLTRYRREDVGFVFQFYNLAERINNFPAQLSGGEQQRVSIARAVAKNPKILLCDEPTGALDYETGKQVLQILQDMSRVQGATVIIVTHNAAIAPIADRVIRMRDAKVQSVDLNPNPTAIADIEW